MPYDTSRIEQTKRNIARLAEEVAADLRGQVQLDGVGEAIQRTDKPGFLARLFGATESVVLANVRSYEGWCLSKQLVENVSKTRIRYEVDEYLGVFLASSGQLERVEWAYFVEGSRSPRLKSGPDVSPLDCNSFDMLDYRYTMRHSKNSVERSACAVRQSRPFRRRWGDGLWYALKDLKARAQ